MHHNRTIIAAAALVLLSSCHAQMPAAERMSLQNVDAVIYQRTSAEVYRLYQQCYELARLRLFQNIWEADEAAMKTTGEKKPYAIITDVDETILDNSAYNVQRANDKSGWDSASFHHWATCQKVLGKVDTVPGAVGFLKYAALHGCEIYYITNRLDNEKEATIATLKEFGLPNADATHVMTTRRPKDSNKDARRDTVRATHQVLLYVGDQLTDYEQTFKDRSKNFGKNTVMERKADLDHYFILLPNSMYGAWTGGVWGSRDKPDKQIEDKEKYLSGNGFKCAP